MRWLLIAALVAACAVMMTAMASADSSPATVGPHRHFIQNQDGTMREVGPRICDNPNNPGIQKAFLQFHANVHNYMAGSQGPVPSAPGLHNGQGGEITFMFGCGQSQ